MLGRALCEFSYSICEVARERVETANGSSEYCRIDLDRAEQEPLRRKVKCERSSSANATRRRWIFEPLVEVIDRIPHLPDLPHELRTNRLERFRNTSNDW